MTKKFKTIAAGALVLTTVLSLSVFAAETDVVEETVETVRGMGARGDREGKGGMKLDLDEETKEALEALKEDGASREEIMTYLEEAGYEMPDKAEGERPEGERGGNGGRGMMADIDEEDLEVIETMKEDGASREEIAAYLEEAGYEMPEKAEGQRGEGGMKLDLDDETQAVVDEMKEDGASREEIMEYLEEQGYEIPEKAEGQRGRGPEADEEEE